MAKKNLPTQPNPAERPSRADKAELRSQRAKEMAAERERTRRRAAYRKALLYGVTVIALAAIFTVLVVRGTHHKSAVNATGMPAIGKSDYGLTVGKASAPHTLIIYEDFICPYCGELEKASESGLDAAANAGKVYIEYRPFNLLGDYSGNQWTLWALNAFFAVKDIAGDDVALKFHNLLYQNQAEEASNGDPGIDQIVGLADQVVPAKLKTQVEAKIKDTTSYKSTWTAATDEAINQAGVSGTPTVILDGQQQSSGDLTALGKSLVEKVNQ